MRMISTSRARTVAALTVAALGFSACISPPLPPPIIHVPPGPLVFSADSLHAAWSALPLDSVHTYKRAAIGCCNRKVWVSISGYANNDSVDVNNPPHTPRPVARVTNWGAYETEMYHFKPHYDAYIYVVADSSNKAVWGVVQFPPVMGSAVVTAGYTVHACPPPHAPNPGRADFKTCNGAHNPWASRSGVLTLASRSSDWIGWLLKKLEPPPEDPAWISCTHGCCTMAET